MPVGVNKVARQTAVQDGGSAIPDSGIYLIESDQNNANLNSQILETAYDLTTATAGDTINSQDGSPQEVSLNKNGDKLYELGIETDKLYQYTLSTVADLSTASLDGSLNLTAGPSGGTDNAQGMAFSGDGTKLFVTNNGVANIYQWTLSTAFDVTTASFDGSYDYSEETGSFVDISFNDDGTLLFGLDNAGNTIQEYSLSTSFVITSGVSVGQSVANLTSSPQGMMWSDDGTKYFEVDRSSADVVRGSLSTSFDISTLSQDQTISSVSAEPTGLYITNDPQYV